MEIGQVLWKITNSERLTRSFERHEIFKGLKKRYKNMYPNVVHVSLMTDQSIVQEAEDPIEPADAPYARKQFKKYKTTPDGKIYGVTEFEPYQLDRDTLSLLMRHVWRKLRQDAEMLKAMEELEDRKFELE